MRNLKAFWPYLLGLAALCAVAAFAGVMSWSSAAGLSLMAVGITFNSIPASLLVPFVAVEFDNSMASQGPADLPFKVVIMGQKITAGTGTANTLQRVSNANQVLTLAGRGSMLHRQAKAWFLNNTMTETWILLLDDNGAGVAATKTITVTGPATATGVLYLYVCGERITVAVTSGDAQNAIATNIAAAITAADTAGLDLPCTAAAATNVVTLTARNKGEAGTDIDVRFNYNDGETNPAGVVTVVAAGVAGSANPTLTTALAAMGDTWFHEVIHPYKDATSLTAIEGEMSRRFGPLLQIDGLAFTAAAGTQGVLSTLGLTRNSPHSLILSQPGKNPVTWGPEFAAMVAGAAAASASADPAVPFQTLEIKGAKAPAEGDRYTLSERNQLLTDGVATSRVGPGGVVQIERLVTTYRLNAAGAADKSYKDANTMFTLMYLRWSFTTEVKLKHSRSKLCNDGARVGPGQKIITPKIGAALALGWFRDMETKGLVENFAQFKRDLVVTRSLSDVNRLEWLLPPDLMNQFIVGAAQIQPRL